MTATFGPQLLGQTEKTLNALLGRGTGRHRPGRVDCGSRCAWPTSPTESTLRDRVADRARFDDADRLVTELEQRGLVAR